MKSVKPKPRREEFNFCGVAVLVVFFTFGFTVAVFAVLDFGRRRLGLVTGADLLLFTALAFGLVVKNAPRTSSSCCAKISVGAKAARATMKLNATTLIFI
jgi:hypothetical protein